MFENSIDLLNACRKSEDVYFQKILLRCRQKSLARFVPNRGNRCSGYLTLIQAVKKSTLQTNVKLANKGAEIARYAINVSINRIGP